MESQVELGGRSSLAVRRVLRRMIILLTFPSTATLAVFSSAIASTRRQRTTDLFLCPTLRRGPLRKTASPTPTMSRSTPP